jgi:hypothetical protein
MGAGMTALTDRCGAIWQRVRASPVKLPVPVVIPGDHVAGAEPLVSAFVKDHDYFQVRFNQIFLSDRRQWWSDYEPMAFAVTEFIYDKSVQVVPFMVGPSLIERYGQRVPAGMLFQNTRVAGLHPYRGGRLTTTVMLFRVRRADQARSLLHIAENTVSVLDFSVALTMYVKLAGVLLDGLEALFGMDAVQPVAGLRREFDPDAGDVLAPGYFALVDPHDPGFSPERLWVRDHQLLTGDSLATAVPFTGGDFVLYSLVRSAERSDDSMLPFYPQYERALEEARHSDANSWLRARADDAALWQTVLTSPDLTRSHAEKMAQQYRAEIKSAHEKAVDGGVLAPSRSAGPNQAAIRQATALLES